MHSTTLCPDSDKHFEPKEPLILIVDNDWDNLLLASCIIESIGINSVVADSGEECLNLVFKLLPNLILLDIVMPNINGLEIIKIIKQNKTTAHIPIIAVTGLTRVEDKNKIIAAGCDDYLVKPYLIKELEAKILNFCHSSEV